jgi:hypothetical protein
MAGRLGSRRTRRRLTWLAAAGLAALGITLAVFFVIPTHGSKLPEARNGPRPNRAVPASETEVPVSAADRQAIDALLDRFVPSAVERKDPGAAYDMATKSMHEGLSRAKWKTGEIPVYPFDTVGEKFHGWTVFLSFANEVELDLLLQPQDPKKSGSAVLRIDVKRKGPRWLVDYVYPVEIHSPEASGEREAAPVTPSAIPSRSQRRSAQQIEAPLSAWWFIVPTAIAAVAILLPLAIFGSRWRRHRRLTREWQSQTRP